MLFESKGGTITAASITAFGFILDLQISSNEKEKKGSIC
jgi:hypothetical protein